MATLPRTSAAPMSTAAALSTEDEAIVAAFDTVLEAEMARGRLETDGIAARIVDGNTVGIATHLSMALGGAKVVVCQNDLEAARAILFSPSTFEDLDAAAMASAPPQDLDAGARAEAAALAPAGPDAAALRALKAAVIGLVFLPPVGHLWSLALLAGVWRKRAELSPRARVHAVAAVAVDAVVLAACAAVILS